MPQHMGALAPREGDAGVLDGDTESPAAISKAPMLTQVVG